MKKWSINDEKTIQTMEKRSLNNERTTYKRWKKTHKRWKNRLRNDEKAIHNRWKNETQEMKKRTWSTIVLGSFFQFLFLFYGIDIAKFNNSFKIIQFWNLKSFFLEKKTINNTNLCRRIGVYHLNARNYLVYALKPPQS